MFGSILGAVGSIAGGLLGDKQKKQNVLDARAFDAEQAYINRQFQREVYQNQIQWKVADAKKAGLHPLAAIGGGAYSASPVPVSSGLPDVSTPNLGKLGESIGDTFDAYMNRDERAAQKAMTDKRDNLLLERAGLENELLRKQINEVQARTQSYSKPMATGDEVIKGQVDAVPGAVASHPSYRVRDVGNGLYDINFSPEYVQELGDELGQFVNLYHQGKRYYSQSWRDPKTGITYYHIPDEGLWIRGREVGYSNNMRTAYGRLN